MILQVETLFVFMNVPHVKGLIFSLAGLIAGSLAVAAETEPIKKEGLTIQLVSETESVVQGQPLTIGLFIKHEAKYHTYWRSPGIVGVATQMEWHLPEGFEAGEIQWPAPIQTKMAQINCYGYEDDTCLITEIKVPEKIEGDSITLKVKAGWMCCATTCHPGWHDLVLKVPVSKNGSAVASKKWKGIFEKSRSQFPKASPSQWKFSVRHLDEDVKEVPIIEASFSISKDVELPDSFDWNEVYFFCNDNQVNSDEPQGVRFDPDRPRTVYLRLVGTDFGPKNPEKFSGVLFHPKGWPGLDTKWIEVSTRWPKENQ